MFEINCYKGLPGQLCSESFIALLLNGHDCLISYIFQTPEKSG